MEDINLHFTGDMHAVTTANNLCRPSSTMPYINEKVRFGSAESDLAESDRYE